MRRTSTPICADVGWSVIKLVAAAPIRAFCAAAAGR